MRLLDVTVHALNRIAAPYTLPLDGQGLVLVEGERRDAGDTMPSNGAGKSWAVVEALTWGLWERMVRHGDARVTDAAAHATRGADVWVRFEAGGQTYAVHRRRTPSSSVPVDLAVWNGAAYVDVPLSRAAGEREAAIAAATGLDYDTFRYAVVVQGADAFAEDGFPQQMAVIETLLRMSELSAAAETAKTQATAAQAALMEARTVAGMWEQNLTLARTDLATHDARTAEHVAARATQRQQLTDDLTRARTLAHALTAHVKTVDALRATITDATAASTEADVQLRGLIAERTKVEQQVTALVCAECKRPFGSPEQVAKKQAAAATRVTALTAQITAGYAVKEAAQQRAAQAQVKLHEVDRARADAQRATDAIPALQTALASLDAGDAMVADVRAGLVAAVERAEAMTRDARAAVDACAAPVRRKQRWVQGFGRDGLQADLFASGLPALNRAALAYSQALAGDALTVSFDTMRASRREQLVRLTGTSADTYAGCSRGEKERINLIVAMSLRALARWRAGAAVNLSIFDEVFDHVDEGGLRAIATMLHAEVAASGGSIFVITHNPTLKALFPSARVVRVVREGGEATVTGP